MAEVTLPEPLGVSSTLILVSLPVTESAGCPLAAALATVNSFTAEAVAVTLNSSLLLESFIPVVSLEK